MDELTRPISRGLTRTPNQRVVSEDTVATYLAGVNILYHNTMIGMYAFAGVIR